MNTQELRVDNFKQNISLRASEVDSGFSRLKSALTIFLYYFCTLFVNLILSIIIVVVVEICRALGLSIDQEVVEALSMTLTYIVTILCLIPLFIKVIASDIKKFIKSPIKTILIVFILYLGFLVINNIYYEVIEPLFVNIANKLNLISEETINLKQTSDNQASIEKYYAHDVAKWILLPSVVLIGPLTEEIVFRKAIFRLVNSKKNIVNIIIASITFALIHTVSGILNALLLQLPTNPDLAFEFILLELIYSIGYLMAGVLLSTCYVLSGQNLIVVFIIHLLNNLLATLQLIM